METLRYGIKSYFELNSQPIIDNIKICEICWFQEYL